MNIVTPIPTAINFSTANLNTEAAKRDNVQRETVPKTSAAESSAAEQGVGSESDRVKTPGQAPQPVVYERPQTQQNASAQQTEIQQQQGQDKDNSEDPSAGKENADSRQQQQQQAEQAKVRELKSRDQEVRTHEQAHAAVGGQYAGSPQYEFETGPDGKRYAVGGEVSIDISEENTPEETLRKMQQVRAAALAPAEPSPQDLRVAQEATQKANEARSEITEQSAKEAAQAFSRVFPENPAAPEQTSSQPELDDIVQRGDVSPPTRSLSGSAQTASLEIESQATAEQLANRQPDILRRVAVIENFYQGISQPRSFALQHSA